MDTAKPVLLLNMQFWKIGRASCLENGEGRRGSGVRVLPRVTKRAGVEGKGSLPGAQAPVAKKLLRKISMASPPLPCAELFRSTGRQSARIDTAKPVLLLNTQFWMCGSEKKQVMPFPPLLRMMQLVITAAEALSFSNRMLDRKSVV